MRAALAFAGLLVGAAAAAAAEQPALLPPWVVSETRLRPEDERVRASAWFTGEGWSDRAVVTLADAFRHIPGAVMQESFGGFEPPRLSIRGSGVQSAPTSRGLLLRLDDLPLGLADGSFNAALFDPLLGSAVAVQRGLDGWRSAPSTMGGAIDLRSIPATRSEAATLRLAAGSFGAGWGRGTVEHEQGATRARVAVSRAAQEGFREHSEQARTAACATIEQALQPETTLSAGFHHAAARYDVPGPLPLAAALTTPHAVSADVRRDRPHRDSSSTRVHTGIAHRSAGLEFNVAASVARTADDFRQLQANGITQSRSDDANLHATVARRFSVGETPHQLRLTADAARGTRNVERFQNNAGERGNEFAHDDFDPTTTAIVVEDIFAPTRSLTGTVGLACLLTRRDIVDERQTRQFLRWRDRDVLPQASLRWNAARDLALFAGISSAAEAPTLDDLATVAGTGSSLSRRLNPLTAQRATTTEFGVRGRAGRFAWDITAYDAHWRNEILRLADAQGASRGAVNAGRTRHRGIEAAARWRLLDGNSRVTLAASTTWSDFRFVSAPVYGNGRLAGMPPNIGYADLVAESPRGVFAAAGADWTHGRTPVDHAARLSFGGRTLAHVRLGWKRPGWTGFVEVRNLFDRATIASTAGVLDVARNPATTSIFLPAPGRSFNVGLEWRR